MAEMPKIPLNHPKLKQALGEAESKSGTDRMSVFVIIPDPNRPGRTLQAQVIDVTVADFVDPGEVNWSVFLKTDLPR